MSFAPTIQTTRSSTRVNTLRFAIVRTPTMRVGRVTIPKELLAQLRWTPRSNLEIQIGADDDLGWYLLRPMPVDSDVRHRARLKVGVNGVGRYATSALVPEHTQGPVNTYEPEFTLDAENQELRLKLF